MHDADHSRDAPFFAEPRRFSSAAVGTPSHLSYRTSDSANQHTDTRDALTRADDRAARLQHPRRIRFRDRADRDRQPRWWRPRPRRTRPRRYAYCGAHSETCASSEARFEVCCNARYDTCSGATPAPAVTPAKPVQTAAPASAPTADPKPTPTPDRRSNSRLVGRWHDPPLPTRRPLRHPLQHPLISPLRYPL